MEDAQGWFKPGLSQVLFAFKASRESIYISVCILKKPLANRFQDKVKVLPSLPREFWVPPIYLATLGFCCLYTDATNSSI